VRLFAEKKNNGIAAEAVESAADVIRTVVIKASTTSIQISVLLVLARLSSRKRK
jgi:hypothetical protein